MRHLRAWALAWVALFWLWMLLAGEWNAYEWVAAAAAATVAATLGELARTHTKVSARLPFDRLGDVGSAMSTVFVDFGLLMWALVRSLVRREIVRGVFRARTFPVGGDDAASVGFRAWVGVLATYSPNAYVVDLEPERQLVLVHDLVPFRRSEDPA